MLNSIQYLRAAAAWMVVLHHFGQIFTHLKEENPLVMFFWKSGAAGVDLFFVISGFVIFRSVILRSVTPGQFIWHRLLRVVPAYWFFTCLTAGLVGVWPHLIPYTEFGFRFFIRSLLFLPTLNPTGIGFFPLLTVGWTLNYEVMFYGVMALTLIFPTKTRLFLLALGIILVQLIASAWGGSLTFYDDRIIYEFILGAALGLVYQKGWLQRLSWGRALVILCGAGLFMKMTAVNHDFIYVGIPCTIIVAVAISQERLFPIDSFVVRLGDWSYSTYLSHVMILSMAFRAGTAWHWNLYLTFALACGIIIFISWASFVYLESAFIKMGKKNRPSPILSPINGAG